MRRLWLVIFCVTIATALLVSWLSRVEEVAPQPQAIPSAPAFPVEQFQPTVERAESGVKEIRIEGHVWNSVDEGVNLAEVDFEHRGALTTVTTGEDGHFVFTSPLAGTWRIVGVRAAHFAPLEDVRAEVEIAPGGRIEGLSFELWPAGVVRGRVADSRGQLLEGAEVRLVGIELELAGREVSFGRSNFTDAAGAFELQVTKGARLGLSHPCCLSRVIAAGDGVDPLLVTLELVTDVPRTAFVGVVVDEGDHPIAGARIEGVAISSLLPVAQTLSLVTDSGGRFSIAVATGSSIELEATLGEVTSGELKLPSEPEARIVLLARDGSISGRVADTSGRPVTDFTVTIMSKWFSKSLNVSSADGAWRIERVPRMPYGIVEVSAVGFLPPSRNPISVGRGEDVSGVDFVVERGRSISGVVFDDETARPLLGALIKPVRDFETRGRGGARTDDQGRFSLEGIGAGRLELRVTRVGYRSHTVAVGPDDREVRIGLSAVGDTDGKQGFDYEGIGMRFGNEAQPAAGSGYRVEAIHPEGGARQAGVEVGDEILAAGGVLASSVPTPEFLLQIKGTAGSVVTLSIRREGRQFELHAVRRRLPLQW